MTIANDAPSSSAPAGEAELSALGLRGQDYLIAAGLAVLTALLFIRAAGFDFLNLDDLIYIKENPRVLAGLSWDNLRWAFTTFKLSNYHPLTWVGYMTIAQLFGPGPAAFHVINVLLHALNAALVYILLAGLTGARWRSGLAAALFAWHPLRMESVAWIAEFKDVLCGLFFLLTLLAYGYGARARSRRSAGGWYSLSIVFFVIGLLAKPMLVTVPFVLLLVDLWPLKRCARWSRLIVEKLPYALLAGSFSYLTMLAQHAGGATRSSAQYPLSLRLGNATWSYGRYLLRTIWPFNLSIYYPYEGVVRGTVMPWGLVAASGAVLLVITLLCVMIWRRERGAMIGWLWFLGMLVPAIGIVQVGSQAMADRYTYLPQIGLLIAIVWGASAIIHRRANIFVAAGSLAAVVLAIITFSGLGNWRNSGTIFSHALRVTDHNPTANGCLALYLQSTGDPGGAEKYYAAALRLDPTDPNVQSSYGGLLRDTGSLADALPHLRLAVELNPHQARFRNNLANTLADLKQYHQALIQYKAAIELDPDLPSVWLNFGLAQAMSGDLAGAGGSFAHAVHLDPANAKAHYVYGLDLSRLNKGQSAAEQFEQAVRLSPNWPAPASALAWLLATAPDEHVRNPSRAIAIAEALNQASAYSDPALLDKLAAAYASAGRFDQAISTAARAAQLAGNDHQPQLTRDIEHRLALYLAHKPYIAERIPATTGEAQPR